MDVFLLQFGSPVPQAAIVPAGEHYHAVVAHSAASRCHSNSSCSPHAASQGRGNRSKVKVTEFSNQTPWMSLCLFHTRLLSGWPCYDADETKGEVEERSEEVRQRDVVWEVAVFHQCVVVVAIKHVWILHEALNKEERMDAKHVWCYKSYLDVV